MTAFKKGIWLTIAGGLFAVMVAGAAFPQGAATLVQLVLGSTVVSSTNPLPVSGTFSASLAGFPTTQTTGTPIAVTTGGVTGTLPAGTVVVTSNVGATNGAYCKLGASATTSDQLIPPNSWFAFTVGANTQLTCITSTSTTTVNMVGGSGLPTGSGGGGGGGGGSSGAVFGPTAAGSAAANPPVLMGGTIDGTATGNVDNWKVAGGIGFITGNLTQGGSALSATNGLFTNLLQGNAVLATGNPIFAQLTAGSAIAGKFGIDQTTVGTTNAVSLAQIGTTTVLGGAGVVGAGAQRVAVGQDTTTIAGAAPGTAGTPSTNVLSVQGTTSMTPLASNITQVLGTAISATNGLFSNQLQGNAVLSQTNPSFASITDGTNKAAVSPASTAPVITQPALVMGSADGNVVTLGTKADTAWASGSGSLVAIAKTIANNTGSAIPAGTNVIGSTSISGTITNQTGSTLTMTAATTAYSAGQLIATSATAGSIVDPSFAIANSGGSAVIPRLRLSTNDTTSTAWGATQIQVDLWISPPTWTNGDRGTWLPATGAGFHYASYTCTMSAVWGDGVEGECTPNYGSAPAVKLATGTTVYWSLEALSASGVTGASKLWTLVPEIWN